jgi:branched-subunit amino acid aminotransferase/4-amino-4-deoxychorismate lyase
VVVRVTVFAPELEPGGPAQAVRPSILVTTRPQADRGLPPLRLRSARYQRDIPHVKHVGLCGTRYHRRAAQLAGADDVLFVDDRGGICEGATWNIGFADGDRLVWPDARCLPGVTMGLLKSLDAPASTTAGVNLASAAAMGAAFVTNAVVGVRPVQLIDDVRYDPGAEVLRQLREAYLAIPGEDL